MEVLATLFCAWLILGALKRRPTPTPTLTIQIIERRDGDDRPPREPRKEPVPEPEVELANRRARERNSA